MEGQLVKFSNYAEMWADRSFEEYAVEYQPQLKIDSRLCYTYFVFCRSTTPHTHTKVCNLTN